MACALGETLCPNPISSHSRRGSQVAADRRRTFDGHVARGDIAYIAVGLGLQRLRKRFDPETSPDFESGNGVSKAPHRSRRAVSVTEWPRSRSSISKPFGTAPRREAGCSKGRPIMECYRASALPSETPRSGCPLLDDLVPVAGQPLEQIRCASTPRAGSLTTIRTPH